MKYPYRKQTETIDGTTSEYFMECEEKECPWYDTGSNFDGKAYIECRKVESDYFHATHLGGRE